MASASSSKMSNTGVSWLMPRTRRAIANFAALATAKGAMPPA